MNRTIFLLCSLFILFTSCEDEPIEPTSSNDIIVGKVESLALGTDGVNSFLVKLSSPTNIEYEAIINDTTKFADFVVEKSVALKGELSNLTLEVQKIISTDNDNFTLEGVVQSVENNQSGYSAQIKGDDGEVYSALFSISNIGNNFKEFNVDESLSIIGNLWLLSDTGLQVTVKDIN